MSKLALGLTVGTVLGFLDGASAWFTPEARPMILLIVASSTFKGLLTGVVAGVTARRTNSIGWAIAAGLGVGLTLSYLAALATPDPNGDYYYWEIMLPGALLGAIAGFASQRFGRRERSPA